MSCSHECKPDWKAYLLGELGPADRRQHEECASACPACREELATLRVTLDALSTLYEEEVPRRIAFVSDKVFKPRWWQSFLRPSFAAGAVIAAAILIHAFVRPPAAPAPPQVDTAAVEARIAARITAEVSQRMEAQMAAAVNTALNTAVATAVTQAVAETRKQDDQRTATLLSTAERRYTDAAEFLDRRVTQIYALNAGAGVR
jgi:anti-sigma factor RsiW